jgi:hypothetical protein
MQIYYLHLFIYVYHEVYSKKRVVVIMNTQYKYLYKIYSFDSEESHRFFTFKIFFQGFFYLMYVMHAFMINY